MGHNSIVDFMLKHPGGGIVLGLVPLLLNLSSRLYYRHRPRPTGFTQLNLKAQDKQ